VVDVAQLSPFLESTQEDAADALDLPNDSPTSLRSLARLQSEIARRGTIDVLRKGINHGPHHLDVLQRDGVIDRYQWFDQDGMPDFTV